MNVYARTFQGLLQFKRYKRTWAFPREVEALLMSETVEVDRSVLQLYGGMAGFGIRLDMDPATAPHVLGNALYPPFRCKSFDTVIVDPPYSDLKAGIGIQIMAPAICLARRRIWWFHTHWCLKGGLGIKLLRWWTCSPCSMGAPLRILAEYSVSRHPMYCHAVARTGHGNRLPPSVRAYDWSRHFPQPVNRAPLPVQRRLFADDDRRHA